MGAHVFSGYAELRLSPSKQVPVAAKVGEVASGHQHAFCGEPKADVNKSSGDEREAVESTMEDQTDEPTRLPDQHRPAGLENAAYNEQKMVGFICSRKCIHRGEEETGCGFAMLVIPELEQEVKLLSESKSTRKELRHRA